MTNHQHIITGHLDIVYNVKLKELILKGLKYRDPCTINFEAALDEIREQLDVFFISFSFLLDH